MDNALHTAIAEIVPECYAITAPQTRGSLYAIWWRIGGEPGNYLDQEPPQVDHALVQIDVWGEDAMQVKTSMQQLKGALRDDDRMIITPVGNWRETYDPDMQLFCASHDFDVRF